MVTSAGHSGTPLAKKLCVKAGDTMAVLNEPPGLGEWLAPLADSVAIRKSVGRSPDIGILFVKRRDQLERRLQEVAAAVCPDRVIWVGWPKKSSTVVGDITEDVVREIALPLGLLDTKVCAISDVWSGLKSFGAWSVGRRRGTSDAPIWWLIGRPGT